MLCILQLKGTSYTNFSDLNEIEKKPWRKMQYQIIRQ